MRVKRNNIKIKTLITIECAFMIACISGCTSIKERLGQRMLEESDIETNAEYQLYQGYSDAGSLDQNGYFLTAQDEVSHEGEVHVTFSDNSNISVEYFSNPEKTLLIDTYACYLSPGESIYANVTIKRSVISTAYKFSGFNIYEFEDGNRYIADGLNGDFNTSGCVLTIPEDYKGTDLAVTPIGEFEERVINLKDYYIDDDTEVNYPLNGTWMLNNQQTTDESFGINPVSPYIVSFEYDNTQYFYLSSSPDAYYIDNSQGIVIFKQRQPSDETVDYSVELHRYLSITIKSDVDRTINVNGEGAVNLKANEEYTISGLMYGSKISIITNRAWPDLENMRDMIISAPPDPFAQGGWEYVFVVPQKGGEFRFDPSEYSYEHGTIRFSCFGEVVNDVQYLAPGSRIYYEQASADTNWWLSGENNYIVVSDEETTRQQLNSIQFTKMLSAQVNLPQPSWGGSIIYKNEDGTRIYGSSINTLSGTEITMEFMPWEGWINQYTNGVKYVVKEEENQTINVDGVSVDQVFIEDDGHKPNLTIILEESVGENMQFSFAASGLYKEDYQYVDGWFRSDYKIVKDKQIGTDKPIEITMGNRAIPSGQAVRIEIEKKDTKGNVYKETRYYDSLTEAIPAINIYSSYEASVSTTWYKTITISIGVVDIERFTLPPAIEHASISVFDIDGNRRVFSGDLIEPGRKVIVKITPDSGYYVTGKDVTNDVYQDTMKYSDYLKNLESIISNHPVKKYLTITLDTSDAYATYTYKIDRKIVSGTIYVREGTEITLEYVITDSEHTLTESAGGFLGIGASNTEVTKELTVDLSMDGTTLTRTSFGIYVWGD